MRKSLVDGNSHILNKSKQITGYADDLYIISRSVEENYVIIRKKTSQGLVMLENRWQSKLINVRTNLCVRSENRETVLINACSFEVVHEFCCLGSIHSINNDEPKDIPR